MNTSETCHCLFNEAHLWCRCEGEDTVVIGVSAYAQDSLGEIAYIELPDVGTSVTQGEALGVIESIKVVNELISPVSGVVIEINDKLSGDPTAVNDAPYGDGWMLRIRLESEDQLKALMDVTKYQEYIA